MPIEPLKSPHAWVSDLKFEKIGALRKVFKKGVVNPFANYFPAPLQKLALRLFGSELALSNWKDPGGWRSMVISYQDRRDRVADKVLCTLGTIPKALRNRRKLAARVIARLIDEVPHEPVHVLCLGAGPGHIINDALRESSRKAHATLVDLSAEAFDYGRRLAAEKGTADRTQFIQGDVCDVAARLDKPPDVVKMIGICEYLSDDLVTRIARCISGVMKPGSAIVFNSISEAHGTDRFFRRVFGLKMIHRSPVELQKLMAAGGFGNFTSIPEPMGVYHVIVGWKG